MEYPSTLYLSICVEDYVLSLVRNTTSLWRRYRRTLCLPGQSPVESSEESGTTSYTGYSPDEDKKWTHNKGPGDIV